MIRNCHSIFEITIASKKLSYPLCGVYSNNTLSLSQRRINNKISPTIKFNRSRAFINGVNVNADTSLTFKRHIH